MQNVAKERKRPLKLSETDKKTNKQTNVDLDLRFPTKWETTSDLIFFTIKEVIFFARAVLFFSIRHYSLCAIPVGINRPLRVCLAFQHL